uniref:G_PROTEIN_RECEP_F1_2 domain-containing protein n=1 Tax=Panagrellus redivivus TaxID=6233 RepID=A0A7E4USI8_PANRE
MTLASSINFTALATTAATAAVDAIWNATTSTEHAGVGFAPSDVPDYYAVGDTRTPMPSPTTPDYDAGGGGGVTSAWPISNMTEQEFFDSLEVFDMLPLSFPSNNHVVVYAMLYALVFLIGVCGNVAVITLIRHVHSNVSYDNTMIYILFLCCVDLASIVPLPMAIVDQLLGFWMFGTALCKVYRILEHVGRALSTFVLAAMAYDRFKRVCFPHRRTTRRSIFVTLFVLVSFTFMLLSPLLIKATSEEIILKEVLLDNPYRLARVRIFKCLDHLDGNYLAFFVLYMFFIGFFIPVLLITLFYGLMMRRLFRRSRSIPTSQVPVNRIAGYTIAISVFFVMCWSPYWIAMLYNLYRTYSSDPSTEEQTSENFIYVMYGIHALPYVNSASNWLLYGMLNSQLMRRANYNNKSSTNQKFYGRDEISRVMPPSVAKVPIPAYSSDNNDDSIIIPRTTDSLL